MKNINWRTAVKSAKHTIFTFSLAVMIGAFWAMPTWMKVGYCAALLMAWILIYKSELALHSRRESRSAQIRSTRELKATPVSAVSVVPESDSAIDAEESAIYALMNVGYPRAKAAATIRAYIIREKRKDPAWVVNFDNHSSVRA